jgi:hypothetical protein
LHSKSTIESGVVGGSGVVNGLKLPWDCCDWIPDGVTAGRLVVVVGEGPRVLSFNVGRLNEDGRIKVLHKHLILILIESNEE